jgi:glycosyltransferase involved in cell wall biosynthesis
MNLGLIIYGSLEALSGGYLYDRKLVEHLRSQGDIVEIISLPWRNYTAHLLDNLHVRLPKHLDIIIQDELNHPSLILANRSRHPYPIISLVHHLRCSELRPTWQNAIYRIAESVYLRSVDGFIFNSNTTKKVVQSLVETDKPAIVAYPPTDRFGDQVSEHAIVERARSADLRILFLGTLIPRKGLHTLLQALSRQPSTLRVDVVGSLTSDPEYAARMQRFVREIGLSSQVTFHSSLDKEPVIEKLKAAHVLVVPSSYEGYGIVYLEGMGFGLPAIGTTSGAAHEIITDGVDGFLIEPEDSQGLGNKLRTLNEQRDVLIRMSLAARARFLRQPKWEDTASRIREFLLKQIEAFSV